MPTVLSIAIGPVQGFIAAARKTQDLSFGSLMLSAVARQMALSLQTAASIMIFPTAAALSDARAGIANKIVVVLPDGADPMALIAQAKAAGRAQLRVYLSQARKHVADAGAENRVGWDLLDEQLNQFLECYAAWATEDNYSDARRQADRLLAGRKSLRDFAPACGWDGIPKSSLDGGHEAVVDITKMHEQQRLQLGLKAGELLDGISLLKRLGEKARFPSTARVAADPQIRAWAKDDPERLARLTKLLEQASGSDLAQKFSTGALPQYAAFPFDTQLLHSPAVDNKSDQPMAELIFAEAGNGKASSYYAILQADGDHMGEAIDELGTPHAHQQLSDALVHFARQAEGIVSEHHGALVYSGGDDVLAMLPLDSALACAEALRQAFTAAVRSLSLSKRPTLSVGVSIAHFSSDLQQQLGWAREAERAAKNNGRNSLAVAMRTRGAADAPVVVAYSWERNPVAAIWQPAITALVDKTLPAGMAYELRQLADDFRGNTAISAGLSGEVQRVIKRKRTESGVQIDEKARQSINLTAATVEELDALVNRLLIARHLARVPQEVLHAEA